LITIHDCHSASIKPVASSLVDRSSEIQARLVDCGDGLHGI